jgi:hypothetical protein
MARAWHGSEQVLGIQLTRVKAMRIAACEVGVIGATAGLVSSRSHAEAGMHCAFLPITPIPVGLPSPILHLKLLPSIYGHSRPQR